MKILIVTVLLFGACTGIIEGDDGEPGSAWPGGRVSTGGPPGAGTQPSGTTGSGGASGGMNPGAAATPGTAPVAACKVATLARPRAWRLTHDQIRNTLAGLGFTTATIDMLPAEARVAGYANQSDRLTLSPLLSDFYLQVSSELALNVAGRAAEFLKCPVANLPGAPCLADFLKSFGLRMWRRPLSDAEIGKLTALFTTTAVEAGGPEAALKIVVQAFFMSPNFLMRTELGGSQQRGTVTTLTDHELASQLSYMLWDTAPDTALLDLAAQGRLHEQNVLLAQATRMLAVAHKAPKAMHSFFMQWLRIDGLAAQPKDRTVFPLYLPEVPSDLLDETRLLLNSVIFDAGGDRSLRTLLTASYSFVNARTTPIYGLPKQGGATLVKAQLNPDERRGLFTLPAFLAGHAGHASTALVGRGRFIREEVLCADLPAPDPNAAVFAPQLANANNLTGREKFKMHSVAPACAACHRLFDGLGFALETYDGIGKYRSTDKGKRIDPSGSLPLPSGIEVTFTSFVDLVDSLAKAPEVYSCFSTQYLAYAVGKAAGQIDDCEKQRVADEFARSGYRMDALALAVVRSPSFMARQN